MGSTPTARMWSYRLTQSVEHMPKLMLFNKLPQRECMGGDASLFVDRPLCAACGTNGGVASMARQLGFSSVRVYTPNGLQVIRP
jgi:hypothetical protein